VKLAFSNALQDSGSFSASCMWLKTLSPENINKSNIATYSVIATTVVMVVIAPALVQSAFAVPAPKAVETEKCSEEKFDKFDGSPGKAADSSGI
jgi:hypothetical protein